jgi:hypothetical protein
MKTEIKTEWFTPQGWFNGQLPAECVSDCSASGSVDDAVAYWVNKLEFDVPEPQAAKWLKEFGAWNAEELADHEANVRRVLWQACCDIKDQGEWFGLVH